MDIAHVVTGLKCLVCPRGGGRGREAGGTARAKPLEHKHFAGVVPSVSCLLWRLSGLVVKVAIGGTYGVGMTRESQS